MLWATGQHPEAFPPGKVKAVHPAEVGSMRRLCEASLRTSLLSMDLSHQMVYFALRVEAEAAAALARNAHASV